MFLQLRENFLRLAKAKLAFITFFTEAKKPWLPSFSGEGACSENPRQAEDFWGAGLLSTEIAELPLCGGLYETALRRP